MMRFSSVSLGFIDDFLFLRFLFLFTYYLLGRWHFGDQSWWEICVVVYAWVTPKEVGR